MVDPRYEAINKAKNQSKGGNPEGAKCTLQEFLADNPDDTKVMLALADVAYHELDDKKLGNAMIDRILEIDPDNVDALKASVTILSVNKKDRVLANSRYVDLVSLCPSAEVCHEYARFLRMQMGDFAKSGEYYEMAVQKAPDKWQYHQNYAVLLLQDLKDYAKARRELEATLRLDPNNYAAQKNYDMLVANYDEEGNRRRRGLFSRR